MSESLNALRTCSLFRKLDDGMLSKLASTCRAKSYPKGSAIFDIGDPSNELYVLIEGLVAFHYPLASGRIVTLGVAEKNMVLGDTELVDPSSRMSRALVMADCRASIIPKQDFIDCCRADSRVYERLLQIYSRRLQQAVKIMLVKDDRHLLCSVLLNFARRFGKQTKEGCEIQLQLSQEDLASHVGAPRQRVNRMLGEFREKGWIETRYNTVILLDKQAMASSLMF